MIKTFILCALLFFCFNIAFSQQGFLDVSFGNGGKVTTPIGDSLGIIRGMAIQPDGKIIADGSCYQNGHPAFALIRYNSDGSLDNTFGNGGVVIEQPGLYRSEINDIALLPNGEILVGGYADSAVASFFQANFALARYHSNGSRDSTFGNNGLVLTPTQDGGIFINKLIVKPGGKILACGTKGSITFDSYPCYAQYNADGSTDSSFGVYGVAEKYIYVFPGKVYGLNDVALSVDGKLTTVLYTQPAGYPTACDFSFYRMDSLGNDDGTFGSGGVKQNDLNNFSGDEANCIGMLPDNTFLVGGSSYKTTYDKVLVKYKSNALPDSSFATNGIAQLPFYPRHIISTGGGQIIVSGFDNDFGVGKYDTNGSPDNSFGVNGFNSTDFYGFDDRSNISALQPDGKIVLAGYATDNTGKRIFALARYNNIVFPLSLLSFSASRKGNQNLLQWRTAQEVNMVSFELQRSSDSKEYHLLAQIKSGQNTYTFSDANPLEGTNYYRLKMLDKDDAFTYSPVRMLSNDKAFSVSVYPNPAKEKLHVSIHAYKTTHLQAHVISIDGKVAATQQWQMSAGLHAQTINIAALPKGKYVLQTMNEEGTKEVTAFEKL